VILQESRQKVLFIHRGALGDFVLTFPLLLSLKASGYTHRILCTRNDHAALGRDLGLGESRLDCDTGIGYGLLVQSRQALVKFKKQAGDVSLIVALVSDSDGQLEKWFKDNFHVPVYVFFPRPEEGQKVHAADYPFTRLADLKLSTPEVYQDLWKGGERVLIHPGSGSTKKNWKRGDYISLYESMKPQQCEFLLGPVEQEQNLQWPGSPIKPESSTVLAGVLRSARALISNDSGVAHLGAFLGVPTIALFRATDPEVWAPKGRRVKVFSGPGFPLSDILNAIDRIGRCPMSGPFAF
jgi:ADP-heptose:LPS heptosyltransferase